MNSLRRTAAIAASLIASVALIAVGAAPAMADHNRGNGTAFSISGDNATWLVKSAWVGGDYFFSDTLGDTLEVTELTSYADPVDSGTGTGVYLELTGFTTSPNNINFQSTTETLTGSLAALGDGIYEIYASSGAHASTENSGESSISGWVRFSKTGGVYNVAPVTAYGTPLVKIAAAGVTTIDFAATDAESVSYELATDPNYPVYGFSDIPCSTFSGSVLSVGSTLCTGGDVWADVLIPGAYWGARVIATDVAGNSSTAFSLLYVDDLPAPYINGIEPAGAGGVLRFDLYTDSYVAVDSYSLECTNINDPADVVTATTTTTNQPIVSGFTVGEDYDCSVSATNSAGTGSDGFWATGVVGERYIALASNIVIGQSLSGKTVTVTGEDVDTNLLWHLVQNPEANELANGFSDGNSAVDEDVVVPPSACVAGAHVLTVTATANGGDVTDGETLTDSLWYTLDASCIVTAFSLTAPGAGGTLAATGVTVPPAVPVGAAFALLGGLALMVMRRRAQA